VAAFVSPLHSCSFTAQLRQREVFLTTGVRIALRLTTH
jgi:hypothetical protein